MVSRTAQISFIPDTPYGISHARNDTTFEPIEPGNEEVADGFVFLGRDQNGRINSVANHAIHTNREDIPPVPPETRRFSFLFDRFKNLIFSLGEGTDSFTFKLEDLLDPVIRQRILQEIQKLISEKIDKIAQDILNSIRDAGNNMNVEGAKKIGSKTADLKLWSRCFKLIRDFAQLAKDENKIAKDIEAIVTLFAKITNLSSKWQKGELSINLHDLITSYDSFHGFLEATYDTISGIKDTVEVLDKNSFVQMAYSAIGCGENYTPFTDGVMEFIDTADLILTPVKVYLKGSNLIITGRDWMYYDAANSTKDINEVRLNVFKASLDMSKEAIKVSMIGLVYFGIIATAPYSVTATIAVLSITSLSLGIYQHFNKDDPAPQHAQAPLQPDPQANGVAA